MAVKKPTPEEAALLNPKPLGKSHPVRTLIELLAVGEILHVKKSDLSWKGKSPKLFTSELEKKRKVEFEVST